jgi:hypothetical protein
LAPSSAASNFLLLLLLVVVLLLLLRPLRHTAMEEEQEEEGIKQEGDICTPPPNPTLPSTIITTSARSIRSRGTLSCWW